MSRRYINPPPAPQSPIRQPYYGSPSSLDQPKSHANVRPTLTPEDVSHWEGMNLGRNMAKSLSSVAGLQVADKELERVSGMEQRTSSLGSPDDHRVPKTEQKSLKAGALAISKPHEEPGTRHYSSGGYGASGMPSRQGGTPTTRPLPVRSGNQPNVGWERDSALSTQAALPRGATRIPAYGIVQATHDKGDRMGRRTLTAGREAQQLLPGPEETRNKARAAQQKSWKDIAPKYEQGSMF